MFVKVSVVARISSFDVEIHIVHSVRSFVRSFVSGSTSFSGESRNAQFSAPRSQNIMLTKHCSSRQIHNCNFMIMCTVDDVYIHLDIKLTCIEGISQE